jgi:Uncharacterized conserved protein (DUF2278)
MEVCSLHVWVVGRSEIQGKWFHGVFYVSSPDATLPQSCVTDFSQANKDLIQYKIITDLDAQLFTNILALPDGFTSLPSDATSGALDYIRSPLLAATSSDGAATAKADRAATTTSGDGWILSDGEVAVQALQQQLSNGPVKMFVFGEPFVDKSPVTDNGIESQNGMHNVHMNQGDPPVSSDGRDHQADDGIWQDGATIFQNADGSLTAFCSKFVSQSLDTDDQGLPA